MPGLQRLIPPTGVQRRGKILFAAQMNREVKGFTQPVNALTYLSQPLLNAGYEVVLSRANVFPGNSVFKTEHEVSWATRALNKEIGEENPDFVAFPVYDSNAPLVHAVTQRITGPAFVFGASFITINPKQSAGIFGSLPNVVMINGEAEYALPAALNSYMEGKRTNAPGVFVRKDGDLLGSDFMSRVSLTPAEHESLELNFGFIKDVLPKLKGVEVVTSRGCFQGCTFCASSSVFRPKHVTWSAEKKLAVVKQAHEWVRKQGVSQPKIGFLDDNAFYNLREAMNFLKLLQADPIVEEVLIFPQISLSSLFRPDGSFVSEVPNLMLRPDGTPFVRRITMGIDYWSTAERARNKGGREGKLTDRQISTAIGAFKEKGIMSHAYWLFGDEKSTIASFAEGLLFIAELTLDHGPYLFVDTPEPVELRTGTAMRERVLAQAASLPKGYLKVTDRVGTGENQIAFYEPIFPRNELIGFMYGTLLSMKVRAGMPKHVRADEFMAFLNGLAGKWRNEVLNGKQRKIIRRYLKQRGQGISRELILERNPVINKLPTTFPFFGQELEFEIEELLEILDISRSFPKYFSHDQNLTMAEQLRRNPRFREQAEAIRRDHED